MLRQRFLSRQKWTFPPFRSSILRSVRDLKHGIFRAERSVPSLAVTTLGSAQDTEHINQVAHHLHTEGILKLDLTFSDPGSEYLRHVIHSLHRYHGHHLPITHSATCGWFWDVRPLSMASNCKRELARSETGKRFPWHTDCSYEICPPRYFALQVLHADQHGGGTLSILNVQQAIEHLSPRSRLALTRPDFTIQVPNEFVKRDSRKHIRDRLLAVDPMTCSYVIRIRDDIVKASTIEALEALSELEQVLDSKEMVSQALHLPSEMLPTNSILIIDNRLWLHSRSEIKDPRRHLKRVRWNAGPFP